MANHRVIKSKTSKKSVRELEKSKLIFEGNRNIMSTLSEFNKVKISMCDDLIKFAALEFLSDKYDNHPNKEDILKDLEFIIKDLDLSNFRLEDEQVKVLATTFLAGLATERYASELKRKNSENKS